MSKWNPNYALKNQKGFTLLYAMGTLVTMSIFIAISAHAAAATMKASAMVQKKAELEDLRRFIRMSTNCDRTLAALPATCPSGTSINLINSGGNNAVAVPTSGSYTQVAGYSIQAKCSGNGGVINVSWSKDNLNWNSLFPLIPFSCS